MPAGRAPPKAVPAEPAVNPRAGCWQPAGPTSSSRFRSRPYWLPLLRKKLSWHELGGYAEGITVSSPTSSIEWAPGAVPFYRPTLLTAMAACLLGIIGSLGPWMQVMVFTINGLDASWWGVATLTMSMISALALITIFLWDRTPLEPRFSVPLAWLVVVLAIVASPRY